MFERVVLVGVGLIGGSLGLALRERRLARHVVGVDRSAIDLKMALDRGAIDAASEDFIVGVAGADLIVLATPIPQIIRDLERLSHIAAIDAVITDVGSTKVEICRAAAANGVGANFVPGHPMAGSERSGISAARPDLFEGAAWALTADDSTSPGAVHCVRQMAMAVGSRVITLAPDEHDRAVAVASHLPHVLAYALAALAGERADAGDPVHELAAGSFRSGTRVARSDPALWQEIVLSNRGPLASALRAFRAELDSVLRALECGDGDALQAAFERGRDALGEPPA